MNTPRDLSRRPIRVLAMDGGGIRGIVPCKVLEFIETQTGYRIHQLFDMIAGTSTGGMLACGLTKENPKTARQMRSMYMDRGPEIFSRSWGESFKSAGGMVGPKFGSTGIDKVLSDEFGMQKLGECITPTMLTAYEIQMRMPIFFTSWRNGDNYLRSVCRATSAGPTYFPPAHFGPGPNLMGAYVDGGLVANNPAMNALIEACTMYECSFSDVVVLSLGTGSDEQPIMYKDCVGWGAVKWVRPLIGILMDGASSLVHYQMEKIMPSDRYLRLQATVDGDMGAMDNVALSNMVKLENLGQKIVDANRQQLLALCTHLIPPE